MNRGIYAGDICFTVPFRIYSFDVGYIFFLKFDIRLSQKFNEDKQLELGRSRENLGLHVGNFS